MSWLSVSDPLALLAIQSGQVGNPSDQAAAAAASRLDTPQRSIAIGEPVPIVFGRWRENIGGGVFISPGATEARFENDLNNDVTASYHLVLSEGTIDSIAVKDVFQVSCRVGSFTQTYDRRAGSWLPGNFIVERTGLPKPDASFFCGSVGRYPSISTLSFEITIPSGFDQWNRQVHVFIRGGLHVIRLLDEVEGPSDNFADLVNWMLTNSGRVPAQLIDTESLTFAAEFLEANDFFCNVWIQESWNYGDLLTQWAPYFLLGQSSNGGKKGLRPLLPLNEDGTISTDPVTWEYVFTEDEIISNTIDIQYTSLADRMPFVVQVIWRQQFEDNAPILRTAEVKYTGTAEMGPYESHDLSPFCTNENHAVKVGAYILAKRYHTSHTIRFTSRPEEHNTILTPGDIVRVRLARVTGISTSSYHDYLYQIERITKTLAGDVSYECSHFPVDEELRSLIALDVVAAEGTGIVFENNRTGESCDINDPDDDTIPDEDFIDDFDDQFDGDIELPLPGLESELPDPTDNDTDGLDNQSPASVGGGFTSTGDLDNPKPGDEFLYEVTRCPDGSEPVIKAYFVDVPEGYEVGDPYEESTESWEEAFTYEGPFNAEEEGPTEFNLDVNYDPSGEGNIPTWEAALTYETGVDPITYNYTEDEPNGKGIVITQTCDGNEQIIAGPTGAFFNPQGYTRVRWVGTTVARSAPPVSVTTSWINISSGQTLGWESGGGSNIAGGAWSSSLTRFQSGTGTTFGTVMELYVRSSTGAFISLASFVSISGILCTECLLASAKGVFEFSNDNGVTVAATWNGDRSGFTTTSELP